VSFSLVSAGDYVETRNLNLSAEGIKKLEINCAAGFLKVNGVSSLREIQVEAEIVVKDMDSDRAKKKTGEISGAIFRKISSARHADQRFRPFCIFDFINIW
jgi:hypothetical protein